MRSPCSVHAGVIDTTTGVSGFVLHIGNKQG